MFFLPHIYVAAISFFLFVSFFVPYVNVFCHILHAFFTRSLFAFPTVYIFVLSFHVHLVLVYRLCFVGSLTRFPAFGKLFSYHLFVFSF